MRKMLGVMRQRMTDGAMNTWDANVGLRRRSSLKSKSMNGFGQQENSRLFRTFLICSSSHSDDSIDLEYISSDVVIFTCKTPSSYSK